MDNIGYVNVSWKKCKNYYFICRNIIHNIIIYNIKIIVKLWRWRDFPYVFIWQFLGTGKISEYKSNTKMDPINV